MYSANMRPALDAKTKDALSTDLRCGECSKKLEFAFLGDHCHACGTTLCRVCCHPMVLIDKSEESADGGGKLVVRSVCTRCMKPALDALQLPPPPQSRVEYALLNGSEYVVAHPFPTPPELVLCTTPSCQTLMGMLELPGVTYCCACARPFCAACLFHKSFLLDAVAERVAVRFVCKDCFCEVKDLIARTVSNSRHIVVNKQMYLACLSKKLWLPDWQAKHCMAPGCDFQFTGIDKHHCRACGMVFCDSCTSSRADLIVPNTFKVNANQRVCVTCMSEVARIQLASPLVSPTAAFPREAHFVTRDEVPYLVLKKQPVTAIAAAAPDSCSECAAPLTFLNPVVHCGACARPVCKRCCKAEAALLDTAGSFRLVSVHVCNECWLDFLQTKPDPAKRRRECTPFESTPQQMALLQKDKSEWVPDDHAFWCMAPRCTVRFTPFSKHHCRACGLVFCEPHCAMRAELYCQSNKAVVLDQRVCQGCYDRATSMLPPPPSREVAATAVGSVKYIRVKEEDRRAVARNYTRCFHCRSQMRESKSLCHACGGLFCFACFSKKKIPLVDVDGVTLCPKGVCQKCFAEGMEMLPPMLPQRAPHHASPVARSSVIACRFCTKTLTTTDWANCCSCGNIFCSACLLHRATLVSEENNEAWGRVCATCNHAFTASFSSSVGDTERHRANSLLPTATGFGSVDSVDGMDRQRSWTLLNESPSAFFRRSTTFTM